MNNNNKYFSYTLAVLSTFDILFLKRNSICSFLF